MASRASLLSGYRPNHGGIGSNRALQQLLPQARTVHRHFESNGYRLAAVGKVYHHREDHLAQFGPRWRFGRNVGGRPYQSDAALELLERFGSGPPTEAADVPDRAYGDGNRAERARDHLRELKAGGEPFFLSVGFVKPHLPFTAPQRDWDLYPEDEIVLAANPTLPANATLFARYGFGELRSYHGVPSGNAPIPDSLARTLIRGYQACVSYVDRQIGAVLDELEALDLHRNTVIVLLGDHGFKLGDHGMWSKHTLFDVDTRVPLIVRVPGMAEAGRSSDTIVELVDLYPTLCELCGLPSPDHLQGSSFLSTLDDADCRTDRVGFTQNLQGNSIMGYGLQTERFHLIEWIDTRFGLLLARELYDHAHDPDENVNIAPALSNRPLVASLSRLLDRGNGWRNFSPKAYASHGRIVLPPPG
jgi:arylsulfatase A-like enzyme